MIRQDQLATLSCCGRLWPRAPGADERARRLYLCAECARSSQERLRGTEQAFDCDRCHQIEGGGTANLVGLDRGRAPLYVGWALCNPCAAAVQDEQRET
jgi:hypothetical protein